MRAAKSRVRTEGASTLLQTLECATNNPAQDFAAAGNESKNALKNALQSDLQRAIKLVAARAAKTRDTGEIVSPCISICRMSDSSGLCEGCFRTRDEIASWGNAGDAAKRSIWNLIEHRMAAVQIQQT